jgi:hypothetical protein
MLTVGDLAAHDAVNEDIWARSAAAQATIQPARLDWRVGEVGAQQAMCGRIALPWVPDLVGADMAAPHSILVVGMAYSGFVRRPGHRRGQMAPDVYAKCNSATDFCAEFVRTVVPAYRYYQHILDALPAEVGPRQVGFTDLCRAALVKVGGNGDSSSGVESANPLLFSRYVEHPDQRRWHIERVRGPGVSLLIALGHVAEHGLLRLLRDALGCAIRTCEGPSATFKRRSNAASWPKAYAHSGYQVGTWASAGNWWEAVGPHGKWNIVTVPHTSERPLAAVHVERIRRAWEHRARVCS